MKAVQIALWALVALALGVFGYLQLQNREEPSPTVQAARDAAALMNRTAPVGGSFSLIDQNGRAFTEADLVGQPTALFFGFVTCPDVCPTTLTQLATLKAELGPAGERLRVVFVTVDPERDTPEQLALYLGNFSMPTVGLTGSPEALEAMRRLYFAHAARVPLEGGGYTMDHTSFLYLLDAQGQFVQVLRYGENHDVALTALRALVG